MTTTGLTSERYADLRVAPPTPTGESQPFWDAIRDGRLVLQSCGACGTAQSYPRTRCVRCWSGDLAFVESAGRGVLVTHSEVHRPGQASWASVAPYFVGLVRLDEGAVLLTHLLTDDLPEGSRPRVADACLVEPVRVGDWVLPFFRVQPG
jgi:uncharacterized OB-fold protein